MNTSRESQDCIHGGINGPQYCIQGEGAILLRLEPFWGLHGMGQALASMSPAP